MSRLSLPLAAVLGATLLAGCGAVEPEATQLASFDTPALGQESPGLASATEDVQRIAPKLEQYYFVAGYPEDLAGAKASLEPAGQELSKGNELGGYRFDEQAREFILCVQHTGGAWATYDTAPMATGATGETGGCPAELGGSGHGGGHPGH